MGWLSGLVSSGVGSVLGAGASAVSLAGGVGSRLLSVLSTGFLKLLSSIGGAMSGVLRFALALPRAVMDGIGRLSDAVLGALGHVASTLSGLLGGAARVGVAALGGAVAGLIAITARAVSSFVNLGHSINDLSASSGLNTAAAGGVVNRFAALGIAPGETASMFGGQNATMFGMKAGLWGLPGLGDPRFASSVAARFQGMQGSVVGQMMSQQMLSSLGMNTEAGRRIASTPVAQIAAQQNYATRVQGSLGLDPGRMASITRQWDTLTNKAQTFTNAVLLKLADAALPYLNRALDVLTKIGAQYAGGIGGLIERGTQLFVQGVQAGFSALVQLGNFLYKTLPSAALGFAASMIQGILSVVSAVPKLWDSFLTGISILQIAVQPLLNLFSNFATEAPQVLAGVWGAFMNGVDVVQAGLQTIEQLGGRAFDAVLGALDRIWASPLVQQIVNALPAAKTVVETVGGAFNAVHQIGEGVGNAVGLPPEWAALLGLAAPALALRGLGGMASGLLGGGGIGGAIGAGARGLGGVWSAAMANPLTRPLIDGAVLGGVGYTALQRSGVLGEAAPGFWEALGNTSTRIGNLWHGRDYNAGVSQMQGTPAQHAAYLASVTPPSLRDSVRNAVAPALGNVSQMYQNNLAAVRGGGRTLQINSAGAGGVLGNIGDWLNSAVQQGTRERSSWARGIDERFGGAVNDFTNTTTSRLEEALAMTLGKKSEIDARDDLRDLLAQGLRQLKEINGNTKDDNYKQKLIDAMDKFGAAVIGEAMYRIGQERYLNLIQPG